MNEDEIPTCWMCRRTKPEVDKQTGIDTPFHDDKGISYNSLVCDVCYDLITSVSSDSIDTHFIQDMIDDSVKNLKLIYKPKED